MKLTRLLPFGITVLSALPLAAQKTQVPVPPVPPVPPQITENPPFPPAPPQAPTAPPKNVWHRYSVENDTDALDVDFSFDVDELSYQILPMDLDEEHLDMSQWPDISQINAMGDQITQQLIEQKNVETEVRRIAQEVRTKTRELQQMRSRMKGDSTGLQETLDKAQQSLDAARESLRNLDLGALGIAELQGRDVEVFIHDEGNNGGSSQQVVAIGGDPERCSKSISITSHSNAEGTAQSRIRINSTATSVGHSRLGAGSNVVVIARSDSSTDSQQRMLGASAGSQIVIKEFNDSPTATDTRTIAIRSFSNNVQPSINGSPIAPEYGIPFKLHGDLILIGSDSVQIRDNSNEQMLIRVYRDSGATRTHVNAVVITMSRQKKVDTFSSGISTIESQQHVESAVASSGYMLEPNRPNPFSERTAITFTLPREGHTTLTVFDAMGTPVKVLKNEVLAAGSHSANFDAHDLPSGVYLYQLVSGGFSETKTMTIAK